MLVVMAGLLVALGFGLARATASSQSSAPRRGTQPGAERLVLWLLRLKSPWLGQSLSAGRYRTYLSKGMVLQVVARNGSVRGSVRCLRVPQNRFNCRWDLRRAGGPSYWGYGDVWYWGDYLSRNITIPYSKCVGTTKLCRKYPPPSTR